MSNNIERLGALRRRHTHEKTLVKADCEKRKTELICHQKEATVVELRSLTFSLSTQLLPSVSCLFVCFLEPVPAPVPAHFSDITAGQEKYHPSPERRPTSRSTSALRFTELVATNPLSTDSITMKTTNTKSVLMRLEMPKESPSA
jgi:hypothetical protein